MSDLGLEICWQINDVYSPEWTFLHTDTTSDAKTLGDEGDLRFWGDLDAELARPYNRA